MQGKSPTKLLIVAQHIFSQGLDMQKRGKNWKTRTSNKSTYNREKIILFISLMDNLKHLPILHRKSFCNLIIKNKHNTYGKNMLKLDYHNLIVQKSPHIICGYIYSYIYVLWDPQ